MDADGLIDLYRHMEWADAGVWSAVLGCEPARTDQKVRDTLYHTHLVQHAFLRTWRAESMETPFPTFDDLSSVMGWGRAFHEQALPHVGGLDTGALSTPMPLAWSAFVEQTIGRPPATTTAGDTVLQVALHSLHHRAQVNMRLRELGATPPMVDYIGWVWFGRPKAEWPPAVHC